MKERQGQKPIFSVVIPLYNKRDFVKRAVDSVLGQTVKHFQLIVVDDGSTDGGAEIVSNIQDSRVELIRQANSGEGPARNSGIRAARHNWIAFLDADDMWFPDHLEEISNIINKFPQAMLVSTCYMPLVNEAPIVRPSTNSLIHRLDYFTNRATEQFRCVCSSSAAIRRTVYELLGGFHNFPIGCDTEYWSRIALEYQVAFSEHVTSVYFQQTGGIMENVAISPPVRYETLKSLGDIRPDLDLLCDALLQDKYRDSHESLQRLVDGQVYRTVKASLYRGDIASARAILGLIPLTAATRLRMLQLAMIMPDPVIGGVLTIYRAWRRNIRGLTGMRTSITIPRG